MATGGLAGILVAAATVSAETYQEYVARHQRVQRMMNPLNVPVANVMSDAWAPVPEYANPRDKPPPTKGPRVFYIRSSRDGYDQLTYPFGKKKDFRGSRNAGLQDNPK